MIPVIKLVPYKLGRKIFNLWLVSIESKDSSSAMRLLLNLDDDISGHIDNVAMHYDQDGIHVKHRLMEYHDFFIKRLNPRERVLDIGCGYGALAWSMVTKAQAIVTGIDLNGENISNAKRLYKHPDLTLIHGDALKDLPEGIYDTIVLSNILEHIEDRIGFIKKIQEAKKPKRWLIRVPMFDRHWHVPMKKELNMFYFSDQTHRIEYTLRGFKEELESAGLTLTHTEIHWGEIWAEAKPNA